LHQRNLKLELECQKSKYTQRYFFGPFPSYILINNSPITYAWQGGAKFANLAEFNEKLVTRAEFNEYGHNICLQRFGLGDNDDIEMSE